MTDSNEFPHFDSLFWKRVHDEFVKKGFKCQYDQPIISEVTKFNPPKNLEGDWGETFFNDDWTLNMKIKIVYEASDEDEIEFDETGFSVKHCYINGKKTSLFDYIEKKQVDLRFPLVANYAGAKINVSFQSIDKADQSVSFYAPVQAFLF